MKLNEHRTTNFATILYIEENSFEKTSMEVIKLKFRKDYNINKSMFVNSKNNTPFESEGNLIRSMHASISRNKAFVTQVINNKKYVSLNETKALAYLKKMYKKYTVNFNGDIASMASIDSKRGKFDLKDDDSFTNLTNKSERKKKSNNLIGNKHLRSSGSKDEESITEEQKKNIKILKENLRAKKPNNNNSNPNNAKKDKKEKITDFFKQKIEDQRKSEEVSKTPSEHSLINQDLDKVMSICQKSEKVYSSYNSKLNELKSRIEEKEKIVKEFENEMLNIYLQERKLNTIYEAMKLKLSNIQSTKKHKYYGEFFTKSKNMSSNYKAIFDKNIDVMKKNWAVISSIKAKIKNKNKDIADEIKKVSEIDNGISYPSKNEFKKDIIGNLIKRIKNNLRGEDYENTDNNTRVDDAIKKFNDVANRMVQEKEDFD